MSRRRTKIKVGNPTKNSRFICLKCLQSDLTTCEGIQRRHEQRGNNHIKDMWCCRCKEEIKALEVRYFDNYNQKLITARKKRPIFYDYDDGNWTLKEKYRSEMSNYVL